MKKTLFFMFTIMLGLSSCGKEHVDSQAEIPTDKLTYNGEELSISESKTKMGLMLGVDPEQFVYMPDSLGFKWNRPSSNNIIILYLKDYIRAIKEIEL